MRRSVVALLVTVAALVAVSSASAQVLWANEGAMVAYDYLRPTYVWDVGHRLITNDDLASPAAVALYGAYGFDENFLKWAPMQSIPRPHDYWTACTDNRGGLCAVGNVTNRNLQTVDAEVGSGDITAKTWGGAFIGAACGNFNHGAAGPMPTISGLKYEDLNRNGIRDASESVLPGWKIDLLFNGSFVTSATTDGNGYYSFTLNADAFPWIGQGTYSVVEEQQPGWLQTQAPPAVFVPYGTGNHAYTGFDFGNYGSASVAGRVFEDENGDGAGAGDAGLGGWTIDYTGPVSGSTQTSADGRYTISNLRPGNYSLTAEIQDGWHQSTPDRSYSVELAVGAAPTGYDFGEYRFGSIGGRVFEDMNADGFGAGDPGLAGWTIEYSGPTSGSVSTAPDGTYTIPDVKPGSYAVTEELPTATWHRSLPAGDGTYAVAITSGDNESGRDFGNWRPATIEGRKFDDHGADGSGEGDPGLSGWTITLNGGSATTTGSDGSYSFTGLTPGQSYTIAEQQQDGWRQSAPAGGTQTVTPLSGQVVQRTDFGNVCLGSVQVTLVDDSAASSVTNVPLQLDEVTVPGILKNDPPLPLNKTGSSTFGGLLPGSYKLTAILPDGVFATDGDLTLVAGQFAVVKTVSVDECATTRLTLHVFTGSSGKVTGGATIAVPGGIATSGFEFQALKGVARGTFEYQDHATGLNLHTSTIDAITVNSAGTVAFIWGKVTAGDDSQRFVLRLGDAGEPGTNDQFWLRLADGYAAGAGATLADGNVQIHRG